MDLGPDPQEAYTIVMVKNNSSKAMGLKEEYTVFVFLNDNIVKLPYVYLCLRQQICVVLNFGQGASYCSKL